MIRPMALFLATLGLPSAKNPATSIPLGEALLPSPTKSELAAVVYAALDGIPDLDVAKRRQLASESRVRFVRLRAGGLPAILLDPPWGCRKAPLCADRQR
jgi:hypothetical protein